MVNVSDYQNLCQKFILKVGMPQIISEVHFATFFVIRRRTDRNKADCMMNILLVHQFFLGDHDGGGSRWNELCRIWTVARNKVTVLAGSTHYMDQANTSHEKRGFNIAQNKDGVTVITCPAGGIGVPGFLRKLTGFISFSLSAIWGGIFYSKGKFDVVIVTSPPLFVGLAGIVLSRYIKCPLVVEIRDLWPESAVDTGVLKQKLLIRLAYWFEGFLHRQSKLIVVLTPAFKDVLIKQKHVSPLKIRCVSNASDFTMVEQVESDFDQALFRTENGLLDKFVITYVGAHGIANHLIQVLQAAEMLVDTKVLFLLIGDGEQKNMLKNYAEKLCLNNVRFIDKIPKSNVFQYILTSDMGVSVLGKVDIFKTIYSNKTFDYFSCKIPVLMAIDGLSRELIETAKAGIFVEPENRTDFAEKVRYCIKNKDLLPEMGLNGYHFAKRYFDREVLAKDYLKYLERVLTD